MNAVRHPYLREAIALAIRWQGDQRRRGKDKQPYLMHLVRVAAQMQTEVEMAVAFLHDIIEDTPVEDYHLFLFGNEIVDAVKALTRHKSEEYRQYLIRVKANPLATKVKLADLRDNLADCRKANMAGDMSFNELALRYLKAEVYLEARDAD